jgi:hypothetical protein
MSSRPSTPSGAAQDQQSTAVYSPRQVARKPVPAPLASRLLDEPLTAPSLFEFACYFDKANWPQPPKAVPANISSSASQSAGQSAGQSAAGIGSFISSLSSGMEQITGAYENPRAPPPLPVRKKRADAETHARRQAQERNLRDVRLHTFSARQFSTPTPQDQDSKPSSVHSDVAPKNIARTNSIGSLTRSWSHGVASTVRRVSKSAARRLSNRRASESREE